MGFREEIKLQYPLEIMLSDFEKLIVRTNGQAQYYPFDCSWTVSFKKTEDKDLFVRLYDFLKRMHASLIGDE